ncbi:hypothetical protein [Thermomonospora umbrina]|uniref:Uncharacterized protein n=1 Tax=Thermomonospora umbrina TaxID=111806 RepID=A0A3D9SXF1_9ACTN|nr:hypothetical protein [Thermomonospora umbrina]REF00633.1 hypothetical protein DFJ69_6189 [Thermomonospora umbrina]
MRTPQALLTEHADRVRTGPLIAAPAHDTPTVGTSPGTNVPDSPPIEPPGLGAPVEMLIGWGKWGVLVCGVAGLLICAGQMAIGRRNRSSMAADGATGIPWVLGGLSLAGVGTGLVGQFFSGG